MEPVSFSLAIAGIPGIFKSCIDCWAYVRLSRSFAKDFGFCVAKLEAAELQLTRWGASMGFLTEPFDPDALFKKADTWNASEIDKAKRWLGLIQDAFEDAEKQSAKYKLRIEDEGEQLELIEVPDQDAELEKSESKVKKLALSLRKITKRRRNKIGPGKKAAWAIYRKAEFESLIDTICSLVDNLVKLFPALHSEQKALCHEEVKSVDTDSVQTLVAVLGQNDKLLNQAISDEIKTHGHIFENVVVDSSGFVRLGNTYEGVPNAQLSGMRFTGARFGGSGTTHAGHRITAAQLQGEEGSSLAGDKKAVKETE